MAREGFEVEPNLALEASQQFPLWSNIASLAQYHVNRSAPAYEGDIVSGASPIQSQAFSDVLARMAGGPGTSGAAIEHHLRGTPAFEIDPTARQDYYEDAVVAPAMQEFQQRILPAIMEQYNASGLARSGYAQGALATAGENLGTELGAIRGELVYRDVERGYDAMENAEERRLRAVSASQDELASVLGAGAEQRNITNENLAEDYGKWLYEQPYNNPYFQAYGPIALGTQVTQNVVGPKEAPWYHQLGQVLSGAFGGGGGGIMG